MAAGCLAKHATAPAGRTRHVSDDLLKATTGALMESAVKSAEPTSAISPARTVTKQAKSETMEKTTDNEFRLSNEEATDAIRYWLTNKWGLTGIAENAEVAQGPQEGVIFRWREEAVITDD